MLNFTYNHGNYIGAYNGRFVFHAPIGSESSSDEYLRRIADGHQKALINDVFKHEFIHWKVFLHSRFGISTIGRRYKARTEFLRGNNAEVINYYKQRTAYFYCSYSTHETVVHEEEEKIRDARYENLLKIELSHAQIQAIRKSDESSRLATIFLHSNQTPTAQFIDYVKGRRASSEFGLQAYIRQSDGIAKLREVSLKSQSFGIFNAAFETELGSQNLLVKKLKEIRRRNNREFKSGTFNKKKMAEWAVIKFKTEHESIQRLKSNENFNYSFDFNRYAHEIARFAYLHTQNRDLLMRGNLVANILSCSDLSDEHSDTQDMIERFAEFGEPILYYFYVHGN